MQKTMLGDTLALLDLGTEPSYEERLAFVPALCDNTQVRRVLAVVDDGCGDFGERSVFDSLDEKPAAEWVEKALEMYIPSLKVKFYVEGCSFPLTCAFQDYEEGLRLALRGEGDLEAGITVLGEAAKEALGR